ncbi:rab5 GDP/GTP exchange factor-like [Discoglossus pictus]
MSLASPGQEPSHHPQGQHPFNGSHHDMAIHFQGYLYKPEMCRKKCGYYGNPAWHGYCSRCWIEQRQKRQAEALTHRHHTANISVKHEKENTVYLMKRTDGEIINCTNISQHTQSAYIHLAPDSTDSVLRIPRLCLYSLAQGQFSDFLKALHRPDSQQLRTHCTRFIQWLQDLQNITLDKKGELVQNLYHRLAGNFQDDMTEERDRFLDNIEKLVMTRLYTSVFCPDGSLDEQKDLSVQRRIKSLHWVTPKMLLLPLDVKNQETKDCIYSASTALVEMDSKRAPQDKLTCVSKASNSLFQAIQEYKQEPATADDFLSCLIYTMLKANPPRIFSNLQYITRFCNPIRLVTGEGGYCFTNLCCAVSFIETLDASSLSLTTEEFDYLMQQSANVQNHESHLKSSTVQQMQQNKKLLAELRCRQDVLIQKTEYLEREVRAWPMSVQGEVQDIISRFPLDINRTAARPT